MKNIRILVRETIQPPIDTPATRRWHTVDIDAPELADLLNGCVGGAIVPQYKYSTFEVFGAELTGREVTDE